MTQYGARTDRTVHQTVFMLESSSYHGGPLGYGLTLFTAYDPEELIFAVIAEGCPIRIGAFLTRVLEFARCSSFLRG